MNLYDSCKQQVIKSPPTSFCYFVFKPGLNEAWCLDCTPVAEIFQLETFAYCITFWWSLWPVGFCALFVWSGASGRVPWIGVLAGKVMNPIRKLLHSQLGHIQVVQVIFGRPTHQRSDHKRSKFHLMASEASQSNYCKPQEKNWLVVLCSGLWYPLL